MNLANDINLDELVERYYWYTVDHRNIHIKLVVKSVSAKKSYGNIRIQVIPIVQQNVLIKIPQKFFWVNVEYLQEIPASEQIEMFRKLQENNK